MKPATQHSALMIFMAVLLAGPLHALDINGDLYGEVDVSHDWVDEGDDDWISNVTKIGFKGKYQINDKIAAIYQVEQEVDIAHGGTDRDTLLSTRNTFIGISGGFGELFFGAYDTPLKKAQGKVDLFNDQVGDIKALLPGEVRATDSFSWHSPTFSDAFSIQAMYVPSDNHFDASKSVALTFKSGDITANVAIDSDMRKNDREAARTAVYDSVRGSLQYTPDNWKLGLLVQRSERTNAATDAETGIVVSLSRTLDHWVVYGQYGRSDILASDANQTLLGVDYNFSKAANIYAIYSSFDNGRSDIDTVSLGAEYRF